MKAPTKRAGYKSSHKYLSPTKKKDCNCWKNHSRVPGTKPCAPGSCEADKSPNKVTETLAQEIARLNKTAKNGKYVIVKGKKMFKAKDGSLHTGQVSDLNNEKKQDAQDKAEDAKGVGGNSNKKVMKDGAKTEGFNVRNGAKSDAQKKAEEEKVKVGNMSKEELAAYKAKLVQRRKDFENSAEFKNRNKNRVKGGVGSKN